MRSPFRVAFLGRGEVGYRVLSRLLADRRLTVPVIFTCRHSPEVGRSRAEFEALAERHGVPCHRTSRIDRPKWVKVLREASIDLAVAMLWVRTVGEEAIATSRLGFLNVHGGMLPRYRGNACQTWAMLNGETEVGVTVHLMDAGKLDSGPIVLQEALPIDDKTRMAPLLRRIADRGVEMVVRAVELLRTGAARPVRQDHDAALYCYPRLPRDGEIDWRRPAGEVHRLMRAAGPPYPGAYTFFADVMDHGTVKKMVVLAARVEDHPGDFCAVPGHLIWLDGRSRCAVVCGDQRLLVLERVAIDGETVDPAKFFRTVRQRFGLDTETLLEQIRSR